MQMLLRNDNRSYAFAYMVIFMFVILNPDA
jgi:hypothetical protein